jgi:hypothetical protein
MTPFAAALLSALRSDLTYCIACASFPEPSFSVGNDQI